MSYFALASLEIALLGLLSGIAGTLIVLRRRSFFAVALSHATFPGGVVFAVLGYNLLIGQALFALLLVPVSYTHLDVYKRQTMGRRMRKHNQ